MPKNLTTWFMDDPLLWSIKSHELLLSTNTSIHSIGAIKEVRCVISWLCITYYIWHFFDNMNVILFGYKKCDFGPDFSQQSQIIELCKTVFYAFLIC